MQITGSRGLSRSQPGGSREPTDKQRGVGGVGVGDGSDERVYPRSVSFYSSPLLFVLLSPSYVADGLSVLLMLP